MKKIFMVAFCMHTICITYLKAQTKDSVSQLLNLSIEKLMNIPIYSASKISESTFDAPLSSSVITKEQIKQAGCTSIMEALRLVPGVIVREQTNGNYDIHIRGLDNIPPNSGLIFFTSSTTLVMIDNYPVYNYLHGGTFWETLPIDLGDVEKIEVVRGPSAALYGPNAVSGVINIITRKPSREGLYSVANALAGSYNSIIANASIGYNRADKISAVLSGNFQNRNRTQSSYYDQVTNQYTSLDSVTAVKLNPQGSANVNQRYPHPDLAMRKYALNGFINYNPAPKVQLSASLGAQHSLVQKEFATDSYSSDLTTAKSDTWYGNIKGDINNCTIQLSYLNGTQSPLLGASIWRWDYNTLDAVVEYKISAIKNLSLTPGIMYRRAVYDDSKYVNTAIKEGLWSGKAESVTKAVSLRADYKLFDQKLRLVGGGRADMFNYPDKTYYSYQLAATYKFNDRNLIRLVQSKANRTPLIIDLFSNLNITGPLNASQTYLLEVRGNKNIKLLTSNMFEAGYRMQPTDNLQFDLELFTTKTRNFSYTIFESGAFNPTGPVAFSGLLDLNNITVYAKQWGATLEVNYIAGSWQIRPFVTVQKTMLYDYSVYANSPEAPAIPADNNNPALYNIYSGMGTKIKHKATPACYGGAYINWKAGSRLNINLNPWFYTGQTQLESSNLTYKDGQRGVENISGKLMMNAAVLYTIKKKYTLTLSGRNCFNNKSREFYRADAPALMVFGGVNFEL
jgi:iron complex outermembrane receptor protein